MGLKLKFCGQSEFIATLNPGWEGNVAAHPKFGFI